MTASEGEGPPPRSPALADVYKRLDWAKKEGDACSSAMRAIRGKRLYLLQTKFALDGGHVFLRRMVDAATEARELDVLTEHVGTYLGHVRAALNYLAIHLADHALAADPSLPIKMNRVEFPVFDDPERFGRRNTLKGAPKTYIDALEAVQPFDGTRRGLWMLHELDRKYRHRGLHASVVIGAQRVEAFIKVAGRDIPSDGIEVLAMGRLHDGQEVCKFKLPLAVPTRDLFAGYPIDIGIDNPVCAGMGVMDLLVQIRLDVVPVIKQIEAQFFPLE